MLSGQHHGDFIHATQHKGVYLLCNIMQQHGPDIALGLVEVISASEQRYGQEVS